MAGGTPQWWPPDYIEAVCVRPVEHPRKQGQGAGCRVQGAGCRVQGAGAIQSHELLEGARRLLVRSPHAISRVDYVLRKRWTETNKAYSTLNMTHFTLNTIQVHP